MNIWIYLFLLSLALFICKTITSITIIPTASNIIGIYTTVTPTIHPLFSSLLFTIAVVVTVVTVLTVG